MPPVRYSGIRLKVFFKFFFFLTITQATSKGTKNHLCGLINKESAFSIPLNSFLSIFAAGPPYAASIIYHSLYFLAISLSSFKGSTDPVFVVPAIPTIPIGK